MESPLCSRLLCMCENRSGSGRAPGHLATAAQSCRRSPPHHRSPCIRWRSPGLPARGGRPARATRGPHPGPDYPAGRLRISRCPARLLSRPARRGARSPYHHPRYNAHPRSSIRLLASARTHGRWPGLAHRLARSIPCHITRCPACRSGARPADGLGARHQALRNRLCGVAGVRRGRDRRRRTLPAKGAPPLRDRRHPAAYLFAWPWHRPRGHPAASAGRCAPRQSTRPIATCNARRRVSGVAESPHTDPTRQPR